MYTFSGRIRFSETNPEGYLKMESLIDYFQDCSTFQSEDLGIGIGYLSQKNLAWLVNAWQIDIAELPRLGTPVVTGTSPYELKGFMGLRNFAMETEDGRRLVNANSIWSLFDMEKGMPARMDDKITAAYQLQPRFEMEYLPRKIRIPKEGGRAQEGILITEQFLDSNHHVNNGQYVRLAMAYGPKDQEIARIRVEYKKQAYLGDTIVPVVYAVGEPNYDNTAGEPKPAEKCAADQLRGVAPGATLVCLNNKDGETFAAVEMTKRRQA